MAALKITWVLCAFHHVTDTLLNNGKEGRPEDITVIIAMDDDLTTAILSKNRSGKLVAIFTKDILLLLFTLLSLNSLYCLCYMWYVLYCRMPTRAYSLHNFCFIYVWVHAYDFRFNFSSEYKLALTLLCVYMYMKLKFNCICVYIYLLF